MAIVAESITKSYSALRVLDEVDIAMATARSMRWSTAAASRRWPRS